MIDYGRGLHFVGVGADYSNAVLVVESIQVEVGVDVQVERWRKRFGYDID